MFNGIFDIPIFLMFNGISLTNKKKWFTFFRQKIPLFASWCIPFFVKKTSGRFWGWDFQENISNWWLHAYPVQTRGHPDILISKEWLWIPRHSRAQLKIASAMTCWAYLLTIHIQLMVFSCRNGPFQPIFEGQTANSGLEKLKRPHPSSKDTAKTFRDIPCKKKWTVRGKYTQHLYTIYI